MPCMGFEPRPLWPYVFSCPVLFPLSHPGQHTLSCSELLLLPVFVKISWDSCHFVLLQMAALDFSLIAFPIIMMFLHPMPPKWGCMLIYTTLKAMTQGKLFSGLLLHCSCHLFYASNKLQFYTVPFTMSSDSS